MTPVRRLERRWLKDEALQGATAETVEAIIDALTLIMMADQQADAEEESAMVAVMLVLPRAGRSTAAWMDYADEARANAQRLQDAEEALALTRATAERVPHELRRIVFEMAAAMTVADQELRLEEAAVLTTFADALGFDEAESLAIYEGMLDALKLHG